ncbi:hypothetical protein TrRE_jg8889 [Triparma retinervis]|uniref:ATPase AAA-type core domain-containing protein n=1 Tax=Triparma retinervis TaxID=2557542 RepID=A0A9W6ZLT9_9STRA|nr:hypothetical protein TrRE_jg8889 [Triparma retinervis]
MYVGQSEGTLREYFRRAEGVKPAAVYFPDLGGMVGNRGYGGEGRDTVLTTMLNCIDGAGKEGDGIFVVGEVRDVGDLDDALVRGGRMEGRVEMGRVGEGWREIFEHVSLKPNPPPIMI